MKLFSSLLLPALLGTASALSDATVYLFDGSERPTTSTTPSLTPEQARLVFAQRLGTSQYHGLGDATESTISYINQFGGAHESLFQHPAKDKAAELVLIVEGVSTKAAEAWSSFEPAFTIAKAPSMNANKRLVADLRAQLGLGEAQCEKEDLESAVNPLNPTCWNGRSKIVHFDLTTGMMEQLMNVQKSLIRFANINEMNVVVVLMPESSRSSKTVANAYGFYEKASQQVVVKARREPAEEPMTESPHAASTPLYYSKQVQSTNLSSNSSKLITGILPSCFASLDSCVSNTNNCSGRGECYRKYSNGQSKGSCFTCGCIATNETFKWDGGERFVLTNWGGSACQKRDVSGPFWLIAIFTTVMVGLISWAIGLMFSIGEEKLPGVIGAGVSSKTR